MERLIDMEVPICFSNNLWLGALQWLNRFQCEQPKEPTAGSLIMITTGSHKSKKRPLFWTSNCLMISPVRAEMNNNPRSCDSIYPYWERAPVRWFYSCLWRKATSPLSAVSSHYFTITDPRLHFCQLIPGKSLQLLSVPFLWNHWPSFFATSLPNRRWLWWELKHSHWINGFSGDATWHRRIAGALS